MRVNIISQGGQGGGGLSITGATLTGPLTLFQDPVDLLEAATKHYVDLAANALSASKITTGILSTTRLPAFSGDLTSTAGDNTLTLTNTTVTPGTYTKVTVDTKGRITAGANLVAADIPNLDYSKITSGKPTTLLGFGINDGVNLTGDNLTGALTLNANPSTGLHAATKQYVDTAVSSASIVPVGGTIRRLYNTAPTNYLRTNGALISKTGYASLYAVIGNTEAYNVSGGGQPWQRQYQLNTQQSAELPGWTAGTNYPTNVHGVDCFVTKNYVYAVGGWNGTAMLSAVYVAPINPDGSIGAWTATTALPAVAGWTRPVFTRNRVYLVGGAPSNTSVSATVYTAPINTDGTLGVWTTGPTLPTALSDTQAFVTKGKLYVVGGYNPTGRLNVVYSATINTDGTLNAWVTETSLPATLSGHRAIVTKNRVYLVGGANGTADNPVSTTVYTASIDSTGTLGTWTTATDFPAPVAGMGCLVTRSRAYLFGRLTSTGTSSPLVYSAPINVDGTLGTWSQSATSLSAALHSFGFFATTTRLYTIGGWTGSANVASVYYTAIAGGLNDYSAYYDGTVVAVDPLVFQIPDTTATDPAGVYTFIRYQ